MYARSGQQGDGFMDEAIAIDHLELELQTLQKIENLKMMMNTESLPEEDSQTQVAPPISETYHEAQLEPGRLYRSFLLCVSHGLHFRVRRNTTGEEQRGGGGRSFTFDVMSRC